MDWRGGSAWCNNMRLFCAVVLILGTTVGASAQGRRSPGPSPMGPGDFAFIRGEFGFANRVVRGAPYTAQAVTEFTRTLADGNRIQRVTTASVARDSDGRTRRELSLEAIGPLAASRSGSGGKAVFISDPVAGIGYVLDPNSRTVRQRPIAFRGPRNQTPREMRMPPKDSAAKSEDLGAQTMQGVTVQGKRVTRTIPAGLAGNQLPIDIVTESWYSPDLQAVVMSKASDPRFGETLYQLTNINRAEPDRALFVAPPDYTVREGGPKKGVPR
jgi:hypothetical protein